MKSRVVGAVATVERARGAVFHWTSLGTCAGGPAAGLTAI